MNEIYWMTVVGNLSTAFMVVWIVALIVIVIMLFTLLVTEGDKIYDGRGTYDLYECEKCGRNKITTYAAKGVTPFIIRCSCGGLMQHTRSFKNVPDYIRVFRWKRPTLEQTMKLSKGMMEHVLNGGLVLDIDDEDLEERRKYEEY